MQPPSPTDERSSPSFLSRLNRMLGDINVFLLAVAIGLATLDFTCFVLLRVIDELMRMPLNAG